MSIYGWGVADELLVVSVKPCLQHGTVVYPAGVSLAKGKKAKEGSCQDQEVFHMTVQFSVSRKIINSFTSSKLRREPILRPLMP